MKTQSFLHGKFIFIALIIGATTTQDTAATFRWNNWTSAASTSASGANYRSNTSKNTVAGLSFTGTSITWVTAKGPSYGKATVLIDGVSKGTYDLYQTKQQWTVGIPFSGLSAGPHTIQVKVLGIKQSKSKGTTVVVDAFSGPISVVNNTTAMPTNEDETQNSLFTLWPIGFIGLAQLLHAL